MKKIALFFLIFLIIQQIQAQQTLILSLDSCIEMSLRNSYDLKSAIKLKEKARAEHNGVRSMFFPKVSLNASAVYMFKDINLTKNIPDFIEEEALHNLPEGIDWQPILDVIQQTFSKFWQPIELSLKGAYMAGVSLQQPIFAGGRIINGTKMAKLGERMSEENIRLKRHEAILAAHQTYWMYVSVGEKVRLAKAYEKLLAELENTVKNVKDVDMINRADLLKIQVQHDEVKGKVRQAEAGLQLSRMALCQIIGVDFSTSIIASDTTFYDRPIISSLSGNALDKRPEYKLLSMQAEMKSLEKRDKIGEYLPTIGVAATLGYIGGLKINQYKPNAYNISNAMAVLSVPITGWWEGSAKIKSAKADEDIAKLELQKNRELLNLQIQQAIMNLNNAYSDLQHAQEALKYADESLKVSQDRYSVGMETLTELLFTQTSWQATHSQLIDAKINYRQREIEYLKAIGEIE